MVFLIGCVAFVAGMLCGAWSACLIQVAHEADERERMIDQEKIIEAARETLDAMHDVAIIEFCRECKHFRDYGERNDHDYDCAIGEEAWWDNKEEAVDCEGYEPIPVYPYEKDGDFAYHDMIGG